MRVDLHTHSTWSDGVLHPTELVDRAANCRVDVLALTDHDELGGLAAARARATQAGVTLVNGVEISVTWRDLTIHVVGLGVDPGNPALCAGLVRLREGRGRREAAMAAALERAGVKGSLEGARRYVTNPQLVGRAHFARYLVNAGYARDMRAVFRNYLVAGKPGYVPHEWATLAQAVSWVRGSGGLAVLAHPGRYRTDGAQRDALFSEFRDAGGAAVEVVTGSHTVEQFGLYARYAARYALLASTGSDFHGPGVSQRDLGDLPELPPGCAPVWKKF